MDFFAVSFVVDRESRKDAQVLFGSLELILIPNCSLLYLYWHSNNINSKMFI